jgi:hypothetical protein
MAQSDMDGIDVIRVLRGWTPVPPLGIDELLARNPGKAGWPTHLWPTP